MASNILNENKQTEQPKKIIDPSVFMAVTLDDISRNLKGLSDISKHLINLTEVTNKNNEILDNILKEQINERDEGEYLRRDGTATTIYTIIDIVGLLSHNVKGYIIKNDGANIIYMGHNVVTGSSLDPDIEVSTSRFSTILRNEELKFQFNRRKIRNIYIRSDTGTSDYRLWITW